MEINEFTSVVDLLSVNFGVNSSAIMIAIVFALTFAIGILLYLRTRSMMFCVIAGSLPIIGGVMWHIIPLWTAFVYTIISAITVMTNSNVGTSDAIVENEQGETVGSRYVEYGNRIKRAYVAKFGYENPEFNKEVDFKVYQMDCLKNGFTRLSAQNWLKRMEHMTESK